MTKVAAVAFIAAYVLWIVLSVKWLMEFIRDIFGPPLSWEEYKKKYGDGREVVE